MSRGREKKKKTIFSSISCLPEALGSCLLSWMWVTGSAQQWEPKLLPGHSQTQKAEGRAKTKGGLPRYLFNYVIMCSIRTALVWGLLCKNNQTDIAAEFSKCSFVRKLQEHVTQSFLIQSILDPCRCLGCTYLFELQRAKPEQRREREIPETVCMTKLLHEDDTCRFNWAQWQWKTAHCIPVFLRTTSHVN